MSKDESELVPMNKEPGYGGTDAEESKKPDIVHPDVFSSVRRRAPALAAPDHRVRAALRRRVDERAGRRLGAFSLQGVHKYKLSTFQVGPCYGVGATRTGS